MEKNRPLSGSFRDPNGFVFLKGDSVYRQVNRVYKVHYDRLLETGLYLELVKEGLLIPHKEVEDWAQEDDDIYKIIKPEPIPLISYPYEWCFSQLKEAALVTLEIQKRALNFGMSLKDASGYNIQFKDGKPIFIDTLSFEQYEEGLPWIAYRQFCQHFLAPLSLMSLCDIRLGCLLRNFIDGIPLDLASSLLPLSSKFRPSLLAHIHAHAWSQRHFGGKKVSINLKSFRKFSMLGLIDNLQALVRCLKWCPAVLEWTSYYDDTNYSEEGFRHKKAIVAEMIDRISPPCVLDLGANTGLFSRIVAERGIPTISTDADPSTVEENYKHCKMEGERNLLPLVVDLLNPSPSIGWSNNERSSWQERSSTHTVMALALIHHLAISNNLPLPRLAEYFYDLSRYLIIEFVPKGDSQVQRLLCTREDIFDSYRQEVFETEFEKFFKILSKKHINETKRCLYLMEKIK